MILVRAVPAGAFKNCCMPNGRFDGVNRHYYFQRMKQNGRPRIRDARSLLRVQPHQAAGQLPEHPEQPAGSLDPRTFSWMASTRSPSCLAFSH
jgi:hypothetical protein